MLNIKTTEDDNRLKVNLYQPQVDTILPEHFGEQYPDLINFLNAYYEYLDSDGRPTNLLKNIFYSKDPGATSSDNLRLMFEERAPGLVSDTFPAPRFSYKLLPGLYRVKGSNTAIDGFFRYFFQENVERILPRKSMFIVVEIFHFFLNPSSCLISCCLFAMRISISSFEKPLSFKAFNPEI